MAVKVYYSTDASAPTLTGEVGSLVNLLQKCLVDGYGAKSSLSWTMVGPTNNKAAFRPPSGTRLTLFVDDNAPHATGLARGARWRGYEVLTTLDGSGNPSDGVDLFPTVAQKTDGLGFYKSNTADGAEKEWTLIGDESCFYLINTPYAPAGTPGGCVYFFGDINTYRVADEYHCVILANNNEVITTTPTYPNAFSMFHTLVPTPDVANQAGHYIARDYDQLVKSLMWGKHGSYSPWGYTSITFAYPHPVDNSLLLNPVPVFVYKNASTITYRGVLPGAYSPLQTRPLAHKETISDITGLAGRTLQFFQINKSSGTVDDNTCRPAFDITGPWR